MKRVIISQHLLAAAIQQSVTLSCATCVQLVQQKKYFESSTHRRLLHEDQCEGIERVIPDTNGAGVPKGGLATCLFLCTCNQLSCVQWECQESLTGLVHRDMSENVAQLKVALHAHLARRGSAKGGRLALWRRALLPVPPSGGHRHHRLWGLVVAGNRDARVPESRTWCNALEP